MNDWLWSAMAGRKLVASRKSCRSGEAPSGAGISVDWPHALASLRLAIEIRGYPILPPMPDAQNDDFVLIPHIIDYQMGLVGMHANRRRDLLAQARGMGIVCEKPENRAQPFVIGVGLRQTELLDALKKDGCQIIGCDAC